MKILVTGATGFLGKRLCERLDELNSDYVQTSLSLGLDLRSEDDTVRFFCEIKPDIIINCAAYLGGVQFGYEHPAEMFYNNIKMEISILEACKAADVKRLINPIGNCSYPGIAEIYKEDEFWNGPLHDSVLAYGLAKKAFCVGSWAYHRQYGLDIVNLVFPNMYGPGDHFNPTKSHAVGGLIKKMVDATANGDKEVIVWGTGSPIREWLYVDDAVEALIRAIDIENKYDIVNVGVRNGVSIRETAEVLKRITGFGGNLVFDTSKIDGAPIKIMDSTRCEEVFNWLPQMPFEEGLSNAVNWYKDHMEEI